MGEMNKQRRKRLAEAYGQCDDLMSIIDEI